MTATLLAVLGLPLLLANPARADDLVPPRSAGGQALAIPAEQLKNGEAYHVTPGGDTQIVCELDAPLLRATYTCSRVVGYVIAPFDLEEGQSPILAGALRIPVPSLRTGLPDLDARLHGPAQLDAAKYPEIAVLLREIRQVELVGTENGRRSYKMQAAVTVGVKDKTAELEIPLRVQHVPFTWGTMLRNLGDMLIIRGECELTPEILGLEAPKRPTPDVVPSSARLSFFLLCSPVSPEKNIDPKVRQEDYSKQLQFITLLRDLGDAEHAYAFGRDYAKSIWDDPRALNRLASVALTEPGIETRDLRFIGWVAQRANELAKSEDPVVLNTLARWNQQRGDLEDALTLARQAVAIIDRAPKELAEEIRATLAGLEAQAGKESP